MKQRRAPVGKYRGRDWILEFSRASVEQKTPGVDLRNGLTDDWHSAHVLRNVTVAFSVLNSAYALLPKLGWHF